MRTRSNSPPIHVHINDAVPVHVHLESQRGPGRSPQVRYLYVDCLSCDVVHVLL